jgi:hypothetical protein
MAQPFTVTFTAGQSGDWRIERLTAVAGESRPAAMHLSPTNKTTDAAESSWQLRGVVSYTRYTIARGLKARSCSGWPLRISFADTA